MIEIGIVLQNSSSVKRFRFSLLKRHYKIYGQKCKGYVGINNTYVPVHNTYLAAIEIGNTVPVPFLFQSRMTVVYNACILHNDLLMCNIQHYLRYKFL